MYCYFKHLTVHDAVNNYDYISVLASSCSVFLMLLHISLKMAWFLVVEIGSQTALMIKLVLTFVSSVYMLRMFHDCHNHLLC